MTAEETRCKQELAKWDILKTAPLRWVVAPPAECKWERKRYNEVEEKSFEMQDVPLTDHSIHLGD